MKSLIVSFLFSAVGILKVKSGILRSTLAVTPGNKREGVVLWGAHGSANCLIGVSTSDPTMPNIFPRGAIQTGAAAEVAALSKERAWTAQAEAQG